MIINQQGVASGGGGVETVHVTWSPFTTSITYTDSAMTAKTASSVNDDIPIGTLVIARIGDAYDYDAPPATLTQLWVESARSYDEIRCYKVTG